MANLINLVANIERSLKNIESYSQKELLLAEKRHEIFLDLSKKNLDSWFERTERTREEKVEWAEWIKKRPMGYTKEEGELADAISTFDKRLEEAKFKWLHFTDTIKTSFGSEFTSAIEQVIKGEMAFGQAVKNATADILSSLGRQSVAKALMATADGFVAMAMGNLWAAPLFFKAAAIYGGIGSATMSAGALMHSGGGRATHPRESATANSRDTSSRGSYSKERNPVTINITVESGATDRDIAEAVYQGMKKAKKYGYSD
ncbi:MAG: hypothetical protein Kow0090_08720 [Myxococcota bacterium]